MSNRKINVSTFVKLLGSITALIVAMECDEITSKFVELMSVPPFHSYSLSRSGVRLDTSPVY